MSGTNSWEQFFDAHAAVYEESHYTKNTRREVDFLIEELGLPPGGSVLDVACGTGRHSVELARRGYAVTGLDLSAGMLAKAAEAGRAAGVEVEWVRADATRFARPTLYDAAICLCEGAFGLLGRGDDPIEQPLKILRNISRSLKPGVKVVLTVLNATHMLRKHDATDVAEGRFDPATMTESGAYPPVEGLPPIAIRERGFVATELGLLCRLAGLTLLHAWGGTAGNWGRRPIDLDEMEIMIVARKAGEPLEP